MAHIDPSPSPEAIAAIEAATGRRYDVDTLTELRELLVKWRDRGVSAHQIAADLECVGLSIALLNEHVPANVVMQTNQKIIIMIALNGTVSNDVLATIEGIDDSNVRLATSSTDN